MSNPNNQPPQAPEIERRLLLYRYQWIAVPLLMLIPLLALLGVFGESIESANASDDTLQLEVRYPARTRYQLPGILEVTVTNSSDHAMEQVSIGIKTDYIEQFSEVTFTPSVSSINDEVVEIELTDIPPGESRLVTVDLRGERYGKHDGTITAAVNGSDVLDVAISTIVFP